MTRNLSIFCLGICCLFVVVSAGCVSGPGNSTQSPTPTETAIPVGHLVVSETQNTSTVSMNRGEIITVKLAENPTTGYHWNLTTTAGLRIIKDEFIPDDSNGKLMGTGGTHLWDISTEMNGTQEIKAEYTRSWEQTPDHESIFSMTVIVT